MLIDTEITSMMLTTANDTANIKTGSTVSGWSVEQGVLVVEQGWLAEDVGLTQ